MSVKNLMIATIFVMHSACAYAIAPIAEWDSFLKSNKKFVKSSTFAKQRAMLEDEQNPHVIIVSCSDSRVAPELIFRKTLGSLFVVRVAGNVADDVVIDSIAYAVDHFDARMIVILGHSGCAAVAGALQHVQKNGGVSDTPHEYLGSVLVPIEKAIVRSGLDVHGQHALEESIQANVRSVAEQLVSGSRVIADALAAGQIVIVGAEYFLNTGKVEQFFIMPQDASSKSGVKKKIRK